MIPAKVYSLNVTVVRSHDESYENIGRVSRFLAKEIGDGV